MHSSSLSSCCTTRPAPCVATAAVCCVRTCWITCFYHPKPPSTSWCALTTAHDLCPSRGTQVAEDQQETAPDAAACITERSVPTACILLHVHHSSEPGLQQTRGPHIHDRACWVVLARTADGGRLMCTCRPSGRVDGVSTFIVQLYPNTFRPYHTATHDNLPCTARPVASVLCCGERVNVTCLLLQQPPRLATHRLPYRFLGAPFVPRPTSPPAVPTTRETAALFTPSPRRSRCLLPTVRGAAATPSVPAPPLCKAARPAAPSTFPPQESPCAQISRPRAGPAGRYL